MQDERILFELSNTAALGADSRQWYVCRRHGEDWQPVAYIASTKAALLTCLEAKGIAASAEGRTKLDALPDSFAAWRRTQPALEAAWAQRIADFLAGENSGVGGPKSAFEA